MSESLLSNPLKFETNPYHNVVMKDRKSLDLTGVKQIDSFDSNEFLLETSQGWMLVQGKDLTLGKLDTERGEVSIRGLIDRLSIVHLYKLHSGSDGIAEAQVLNLRSVSE